MSEGIGVSLTVSGLSRLFGGDLARVLEVARRADELGIDQIAVTDHLAIGPRLDRYPYGAFPFPSDEPWPEPLTTLAAVAGATRRIRLATAVLIAPLRPPLLLAKTAATLDVLSGGRLDLGVGVGWQEEEYAGSGVAFGLRWRRLDETLRTCRAVWSEGRLGELHVLPRPVQKGGIPIWLGAAPSARNARRIAELCDGWMPITTDLAALREGVARLREAFAAAGRDPAELRVRAHAASADDLPALAAAGVTVAAFALARHARRFDEIAGFLERLAGARA